MPAYFGMLLKTGEGWSNIGLLPHGAEVIRQLALMNKLQGGFFLCGFFVFFKPIRSENYLAFLIEAAIEGRRKPNEKDTYSEEQVAVERQTV